MCNEPLLPSWKLGLAVADACPRCGAKRRRGRRAVQGTGLCPSGFRFRRVVAMHEASLSRPFKSFRRARPGAFAAM